MSNKNVLADLISGHLTEARTRAERSMRAASVARAGALAQAAADERAMPAHLTRAEVKELRAEARAQAKRLVADLTARG
ncbi:hypothetical protein ACWEOI_15310 [Nocardia sp. NPDC004340]|uniref:hypothetical protein n=1 Tax=Nocardia sp. CA-136227 TaxID=3239979 RepID=UPI003D9960BC